MAELPTDVERLLAVTPEEFVEERARIARNLRDEGRAERPARSLSTKKPPLVVLAVNRAARDRPQAARDAAAQLNDSAPLSCLATQRSIGTS